ncbi:MAG: DUF3592 domain-containing protein [Roseiflexaceae bacterium]|nr:DUF3592 domain-containing protein [Roseiflexaceae bacterium]
MRKRGCSIEFLLLFFGIVAILFTVHWVWYMATASRTRGTVVDHVRERRSGNQTYSYPIVEFTVPGSGQVIRFKDKAGSSPARYQEGDVVQVLYNPANPQDAAILDWEQLLGRCICVPLLGLVFLVVGYRQLFSSPSKATS